MAQTANKYDALKCYEVKFDFQMEFYSQKEIYESTLLVNGNSFYLDNGNNAHQYSNGITQWTHFVEDKEIRITDQSEENGMLLTKIFKLVNEKEINYQGRENGQYRLGVIVRDTINRTAYVETIHIQHYNIFINPETRYIEKVIFNDVTEDERLLKDSDLRETRTVNSVHYTFTFTDLNLKSSCGSDKFELSQSQLTEYEKNGVYIDDLR